MMSLRRAKKEIRENVERGAALLDKRQPRWFTKIDLDAFQLSSGQYCICGQLDAVRRGTLGGDWEVALKRLFGRKVNLYKRNSRDETHGFSINHDLSDVFHDHGLSAWSYAEGVWKTQIVRRRKAAKAAARELIAA